MTNGLLLIFAAVVCFTVATLAVLFNAADVHYYPVAMAVGCALGFVGVKIP